MKKISAGNGNTNIGFLWSNVKILYYGSDHLVESTYIHDFSKYMNNLSGTLFAATEIGTNYCLAVKKEVLDQLGGFDQEMAVGEDTELIVRMLSNGITPAIIPTIGVITHRHSEARLTSSFSPYSDNKIYEQIIARYADFF